MIQCADVLTNWRRNTHGGMRDRQYNPWFGAPDVGSALVSLVHGGGHGTVGGKARNSRPPLVGRIAPVVEGRLSGRPRIERTAR